MKLQTDTVAPLGGDEFIILLPEATRDQAAHLAENVNLAVRHFRDPQLAAWLGALLERHAVPPAALQLELTESTLLDRGAETATTIEALRRLGLHLAIHDFGTGYSNLAYLNNLPVAELKIDRSFVRDLENDLADRAIAAAVVGLSHNLGLKVVGEGVETEG